MKNIILVMISVCLLSCSNEEIPNSIPVSINLYLEIVDEGGADLLNSENSTISQGDIKVFYKENGQLKEVFNPEMDNPRNYSIFFHEGKMKNLLALGLGGEETILKLSDTISESFIPEWHLMENGGKVLSKIYYKGNLVYDNRSADDVPSLKIIL
ncbi:hypothetical protein J0A67_12305 [Algoriphagus aestuariicola]|uniref:Lipoprotein n=1 Tax=Algoriphagus aestuariicola TaxID=1852016 RepID=A0ABS3BS29_9BACT|nr:hypothetical protein [Algoriphagus aestuariicola]MBN7801649.1 hypothetical protein [Algoriphagus aestuariicola]